MRCSDGLAALFVAAAMVGGCGKTPALPPGVTALSIEDPREHWQREGYVQLVPPVHLPSSSAEIDQVEIWAKLAPGASIELAPQVQGAPVGLRFGPGSVLDRVEYATIRGKRFVVDVRGTTIEADGTQRYHVYRRGERGLFGLAWSRDDEGAHARATEALKDRLATLKPAKSMSPDKREKFLASVAAKNRCTGCHVLSRATNRTQGEFGLVNRGTDASGFFTPWTLFADEIPLEKYGAHDHTLGDVYAKLACAGGTAPTGGARTCPDGGVATTRYDVPRALAAGDSRALSICTGRLALAEHMGPALRERFAASLQECEDSPVTIPGPPG